MKKILLTSLLLITATSLASSDVKTDSFSIRKGVKFGMSQAEVMSIDKQVAKRQAPTSELLRGKTTLFGYDFGMKYYFVDSKLYSLVYTRHDPKTEEKPVDLYNRIYDNLVSKYGEPAKSEKKNDEKVWKISSVTIVLSIVKYDILVTYTDETVEKLMKKRIGLVEDDKL